MKKILLALAFALVSLSPTYASESSQIVYYEDYDLDEVVGLKEKKETIKENKFEKPSQGNFAKAKTSDTKKPRYVGDGDIPIVNQKVARVSYGRKTYLADVTNGPIKANMSSGKFHRPGQQGYNKISVDNVTWFSSAEAARKAGYIAAKR